MAHRFFSQIVAEDESEDDSDDVVGFVPRNEDLTVEYDTCIDISSVGVVDEERAEEENEGGQVTGHVSTSDHVTGDVLNELDDDVSSVGSVGGDGDVVEVDEKDIAETIVTEVGEARDLEAESRAHTSKSRDIGAGSHDLSARDSGSRSHDTHSESVPVASHTHSQTITVTRAPRLRPDLSDSEMSGISDESEVEVEVEVEKVDADAPLTDVINGIVRERRKQAKREARKRAKAQLKNKGYKIAKPHKKHEYDAKELEAIERQLNE